MAIDSAAVELVKKFLAAMQARDLDTARSFLSPDAKMIFPGDNVFTSLEAMVADALVR